jgi:hypothetical protein
MSPKKIDEFYAEVNEGEFFTTTDGSTINGPKQVKIDSILLEHNLIGLQDMSTPEKYEVRGKSMDDFIASITNKER